MFNAASPNDLIAWCRALRHGLDVGLSPVRVFRGQAKSGPSALRPIAERLADRLETGDTLDDALKPEAKRFPPLFVQLIAVGEQTGRLPDVFQELEEHFESVKSARKALATALIWPAIMYVGAVLTIAAMLFVMGMLGLTQDVLGFGLVGVQGAIIWLAGAAAFTAAVLGAVYLVASNQQLRPKAEALLLHVPVVGGCFRAFALSRFCSAFHMTAEAGLRADRCLKFSLNATANDAYMRRAEPAAKLARKGDDLPSILAPFGSALFPDDFLTSLHVGEDTGRLPEVLKKQAEIYREEARRKLKLLAQVIGGVVYATVGLMLVVLIFRLVMKSYIDPLNNMIKATENPDAWMRDR